MKAEFWHQRWSENQIGFHQDNINSRLVKFWPTLDTGVGDRIFIPLCGKSKDMLWLAQQGYQVFGVEISATACRDFFKENGLKYKASQQGKFEIFYGENIELWAGDIFNLEATDMSEVRAVYDRASLVAFPPEMRQDYAAHLGKILVAKTTILLITMEYDESQMKGPPFSVEESNIAMLFSNRFKINKISEASGPEIAGNLRNRGLKTLTEKIILLTKT